MLEPVSRRGQRGLSLVELLVGLALGLLVVAGGAALLARQHLREHRALLLEARLMQDLRTAADLVARDLRRAGYWGDAGRRRLDATAHAGARQPVRRARARSARRPTRRAFATRATRPRTTCSTATSSSAFACATARSSCSSAAATGRR